MEKNNPTPEQNAASEDILAKAKANKKTLIWAFGAVIVVIICVLIWLMVAQAGSRKADELAAKADNAYNDSIAIELYQKAADAGYKSGNRAAAELGIRYFQQQKYEDAIKALDDADLDDNIAAAGVYSLKGDCYANLDQLDQAIKCFNKAIAKADKNPEIVPFILIKEANIYRAQENYAAEAKAYKTIIEDYPSYVATTRTDIKKYYERAAAQSK